MRLLSPLLLFGGASFLLLLLWVGLLSPPLLLEGAALPSLSLGGVLGGATFSFSSVGWCRLASLFGWCCVWPSLLLRGAAFLLLLWVGLLFLSSSLGWCCLASFVGWCCVWPSLLLRGAAFLLLLWVGLLFLSSSLGWCCLASFVGWCCVIPSLFAWCCLPSPPSLGGSLSKRKIKKTEKNEVKNKNRNKEKQRGKKEETKKKKKFKSEFLNPVPDEKVHLSPLSSLSPRPPSPRKGDLLTQKVSF